MTAIAHIPVLLDEAVRALNLDRSRLVVDATYGRGGHSRAILEQLSPDGQLIVIDRDLTAVELARSEWKHDARVQAVHAPFSKLVDIISSQGVMGQVDAILFDFGVSSPQLDQPERGFSFNRDGPLDMRMDQSSEVTASSWIKCVEEDELIRVLRVYGEERFARKIARSIKQTASQGDLNSTAELAKLVSEAVPTREKNKHPATRTFQAIRIAVNNELSEIESVLPQALEVLSDGGRMVFISFHSLEDRIVKIFLRDQASGDPYPKDLPVTQDMLHPRIRRIGKAVKPGLQETVLNPRARSAIMRVAEKLPGQGM